MLVPSPPAARFHHCVSPETSFPSAPNAGRGGNGPAWCRLRALGFPLRPNLIEQEPPQASTASFSVVPRRLGDSAVKNLANRTAQSFSAQLTPTPVGVGAPCQSFRSPPSSRRRNSSALPDPPCNPAASTFARI